MLNDGFNVLISHNSFQIPFYLFIMNAVKVFSAKLLLDSKPYFLQRREFPEKSLAVLTKIGLRHPDDVLIYLLWKSEQRLSFAL